MLNAARHPSKGPLALREPAPLRAGAGADTATDARAFSSSSTSIAT